MSAADRTKVFGINIPVGPKFLVGGLLAVAALLFWSESGGSDSTASGARVPGANLSSPLADGSVKHRRVQRRRVDSEGNKLELKVIDITRADIDPALRLDLLARLQGMPEPGQIRNVFEVLKPPDPAPKQETQTLIVNPAPPAAVPPPPPVAEPPFAIALKYCGFVKPADGGKDRKGFFLDGEAVLIGSEGEILKHRYRIVGLTTASAELEDVEVKKGETLSLLAKATQ